MNSVDHVPQTLASHIRLPEVSPPQSLEGGGSVQHGADMLKPDPRDTFYSSKSASHHFQTVPFSCPHLCYPAIIFSDWLIDRLTQVVTLAAFRRVVSSWLSGFHIPYYLPGFPSWPDHLPAFRLPCLFKAELSYLFVPDLKYLFSPSPPSLSSYDRPLPAGKRSSGVPLLSNIRSQRLSHRQIPGPAVCKSPLTSPSRWIAKKKHPLRVRDDAYVCVRVRLVTLSTKVVSIMHYKHTDQTINCT